MLDGFGELEDDEGNALEYWLGRNVLPFRIISVRKGRTEMHHQRRPWRCAASEKGATRANSARSVYVPFQTP